MKRMTTMLLACLASIALLSCEKIEPVEIPEPQKEEEKQPEDNNICVFYGNNSWSYTPLGKVDSLSAEDLKAFFGTGDISVTYSLKQ